MSKLIEQLRAEMVHPAVRTYKPARMASVLIETDTQSLDLQSRLKWGMTATLGCVVNIDYPAPPGALDTAKTSVARGLVESIFGEFRQPLVEARIEALHGDPDKAAELIEGVLKSMFDV